MKFPAILSVAALAGSSVYAHPVQHEERDVVGNAYVLTKPFSGTTQPRLEIRQMKDTQPVQYTLLIVALTHWMNKAQSNLESYFTTASIHGVPRDDFNKVSNCGSGCANADGYGVHDSVLFPTWHRLYLRHFEQEFLLNVQEVLALYPEAQRNSMASAAAAIRWPYYDSAAKASSGRPTFPLLLSNVNVKVNFPDGAKTVGNPLFRYDIADPSQFFYGPFNTWKKTFRYPNTNANTASSGTQSCINAMGNIRQSLADQFYGLFSNCKDYLHFSNDKAKSSSTSCATSVEDIHNTIHTALGGGGNRDTGLVGGHMTYLPLSSFDPVFWLHHANIDRIFAMWQVLNPNQWIPAETAVTASWTIAVGSQQSASSVLTPFLKSYNIFTGAKTTWNSNDVKDWTKLGYTYPEVTKGLSTDASKVRGYINSLYGPNANAVAGSIAPTKRSAQLGDLGSIVGGATDAVSHAVAQPSTDVSTNAVTNDVSHAVTGVTHTATDALKSVPVVSDISPKLAPNGSVYQYVANVYTPRYLLNGSYNVFLFNGQPQSTEDTTTWIADKNLIGMVGVLSKPNMETNKLISSGQIPLTRTLQSKIGTSPGLLSSLTEALVAPFLTQNLQWMIQGPKGEPIDPATVPGFVVSVFASTSPQVADDELPQWSEFINMLDVTKGQAGGANSTQQTIPTNNINAPSLFDTSSLLGANSALDLPALDLPALSY